MENPVEDIHGVLKALCQGTPDEQQAAVETYFVPDVAFVHPFCRVPRIKPTRVPHLVPRREQPFCSRDAVRAIYRWYRFMSPRIDFDIDSRAYDKRNNILYLTIRQRFAIWFIPFYSANVRLVTEVHLSQQPPANSAETPGPSQEQQAPEEEQKTHGSGDAAAARPKYYIVRQEDHYQVNEYLRFVLPVVGPFAWAVWQLISTLICMLLALPILFLDRTSKGKLALPGA